MLRSMKIKPAGHPPASKLAIFARYPVPGEAKTRFSPSIPPELATQLHAAMVEDAVETALVANADQVALYWASDPAGRSAFPLPSGVIVRAQSGPDLGARLSAAFAELLEGASSRAVVIGTDCPDLAPEALRRSLLALEDADLVLGPARDGGYYLIGLRRSTPGLFTGIEWGTDRVLEETLERAARVGLRAHWLETLEDLDTPADLVRFIARRSVTESRVGLRTEAALRVMGLLPPRG